MSQFSLAQLTVRIRQGASALFGPIATPTTGPSYEQPSTPAPSASAVFGSDHFSADWRKDLDLIRREAQTLIDELSTSLQPAPAFGLPGLDRAVQHASSPAAAPARPPAPAARPVAAPAAPAARPSAPYINQYRPNGWQSGYTNGPSNCGPTSVAMIARAFGYGQGLSDAQLVNKLGAYGGTTSDGTSVNGIVHMASLFGRQGEAHGPGPDTTWIAAQLRAGKLVVANGDYYALDPHHGNVGTAGHFIAVVGQDAAGNFLVDDPADATLQNRAYSAEQLARFMRGNHNGGYQIAIG